MYFTSLLLATVPLFILTCYVSSTAIFLFTSSSRMPVLFPYSIYTYYFCLFQPTTGEEKNKSKISKHYFPGNSNLSKKCRSVGCTSQLSFNGDPFQNNFTTKLFSNSLCTICIIASQRLDSEGLTRLSA